MKCPLCTDTDLVMTERVGIEIDYCPKCRGVWLDRGELDKIIQKSDSPSPRSRDDDDDDDRRDDDRRSPSHDPHYQKKRKSFWSELFD